MDFDSLQPLLERAITSRSQLFDPLHETAFRLFNGFSEGYPDLVLDVYGRTLVIHNYGDDPETNQKLIEDVSKYIVGKHNWIHASIVRARNGKTPHEKNGYLIFGDSPTTRITEHGVWYAIDLTMNRDASFYLDTRNLRKWLIKNSPGKSMLNMFAYTGSLGIAGLAGGAASVIQVDRNRRFLEMARGSYALNKLSEDNGELLIQDFFTAVAKLKRSKQDFDCVILDPPFFSATSKGKVDQVNESTRLINKVRPLVRDEGSLIAINNALYVSGRDYMNTLDDLCKDGYLKIEKLIPVPEDVVGHSQISERISDPAPFNHSTKIAILRVKRKGTNWSIP